MNDTPKRQDEEHVCRSHPGEPPSCDCWMLPDTPQPPLRSSNPGGVDSWGPEVKEALQDFVNDHGQTVRWLRNQNPDEVADALAKALDDARREERERVTKVMAYALKDSLGGIPCEDCGHAICIGQRVVFKRFDLAILSLNEMQERDETNRKT